MSATFRDGRQLLSEHLEALNAAGLTEVTEGEFSYQLQREQTWTNFFSFTINNNDQRRNSKFDR